MSQGQHVGDGATSNNQSSGLTVKWAEHPKCPKCGDSLELRGVHVEDFPYIHADLRLQCPTCSEVQLFGIPHRKDTGLALHVLDSNPVEAVAYQARLKPPRVCPWGHGEMYMTKIFGDWVFKLDKVEYQWKCHICFVTRHELHNRKFAHKGDREPLTPEEEAELVDRLRKMGYV